MKRVQPLSSEQSAALQQLHQNGPTHRQRQRAHAVLLSARGYKLDQLADIFACDRDTVSQWLNLFHRQGIAALADAAKPGRPPKLDAAAQHLVRQAVQHPTPNLKATLLATLKKTG